MKDKTVIRQEIGKFIKKLNSAEDIYALFKNLNYPEDILFKTLSKRKKSAFDLTKEESPKVKEIYSILSFDEKLPVFLIESSTSSPSFIRYITKVFADKYIRFLLILTTDYEEIVFVFPDYEKKQTGTHKLKITKLIVNKKEIHYTDAETLSNLFYTGKEASWRDAWRRWKEAFNVERVTIDFFEDYKKVFFRLRDTLNKQNISRKDSHEFTLQFLNRLMFIYFISKKGWLKYSKVIAWLWRAYLEDRNKGNSKKDSFYKVWLSQIFFKAFNNRSSEIAGLPAEVKKVLSECPYLNGGLFNETEPDKLNVKITDDIFKRVLEFFETYNFTIKEDMPLESEVAVDPQMLGYVYESLANVAEEIYDRNDMGIFYTPRIEVDFMCRRSLVEYLSRQLSEIPKEKFYHLVFDSLEDKEKIEKYFQKEKLWNVLEETLDNLSVVDPACGSGAFLVGMLNALAELYKIIYKYRKVDLTDFQLKNRIVGKSLYGVDVMPWAIHAAELRLWLQLIIETEFKKEELRRHALLPNLNMNLRIGDSLVQEIGGINFNLRGSNISSTLKKRLNSLKIEKQNYFNNVPTAKFKTKGEIIKEETRIFEEIINERIEFIKNKIEEIKKTPKQLNLLGESAEDKEAEEKRKARIDELLEEKSNLKEVLKNLGKPEKKPFVWDIDFAEIFGDKNGFDIVIGNPPYVRQEKISPPNRLKAEVALSDRREYKEKLIKSVQTQFSVVDKIDKKSDYYIYFYFHGLSLLNEKGTFCFITSNSWLDVGYGKNLQEFLLKYVPIVAIYDNPKRSFAHADINTIIALFGPPKIGEQKPVVFAGGKKDDWSNKDNTAKFVMFKKPFEEVLSAQNFIDIENIEVETRGEGIAELVKNVIKTNDCRVFPIFQEDLLEDGWEYPEGYNVEKQRRFKIGNYGCNKLGSKYLKAPDVFFIILEKGENKFEYLNKAGKILIGLVTGANTFFMVNKETIKKFKLSNDYLFPVMRTPKESEKIMVHKKDLKYKVLMIDKVTDRNLKAYLKHGEKEKIHRRPTCSARSPWYRLHQTPAPILFPYIIGDRHISYLNVDLVYANREVERFIPSDKALSASYCSFLNSTVVALFREIYGRTSLGGGALKLEVLDLQAFPMFKRNTLEINKAKLEKVLNSILDRPIKSIFEECGINPNKPIREQEPKPLSDRKELDDIIFDALGLIKEEQKKVYWAVCELVKQRLEKARSLDNI